MSNRNDLPPEVQDALPHGWGFGFWFENPGLWHYRLTSPDKRIFGYVAPDFERIRYRGGLHQFDANIIRWLILECAILGRADITIDTT